MKPFAGVHPHTVDRDKKCRVDRENAIKSHRRKLSPPNNDEQIEKYGYKEQYVCRDDLLTIQLCPGLRYGH